MSKVTTLFAAARAFFGMPEAQEEEIVNRMNDEMESRDATEGEDDSEEQEQEQEQEATSVETTDSNDNGALQAMQDQLNQLQTTVTDLQNRLAVVEAMDAADQTAGKREASEENSPVWMNRSVYDQLKGK